jgi:hypothetical protein
LKRTNVADSRSYLFSAGRLNQLSHDDGRFVASVQVDVGLQFQEVLLDGACRDALDRPIA